MSNLLSIPMQDDFETTLSQSWNGTSNTINVNSVPDATTPAGSNYSYLVVSPWQSNMQVRKVTAWESVGNTFTATTAVIKKGTGLNYSDAVHASGSVVRFSNNYQFREDIQTAINSKLDANGGNTGSAFDLDLTGSSWRIRNDAGVMKFTDNEQAEVSLAELADDSGVNDKVKVSNADTTAAYLNEKLTAGDWLSKTIINPAGDEVLDLDLDRADTAVFKSTSAGAGDSGKIGLLNGSGKYDSSFLPTYPTTKVDTINFTRDTSVASSVVTYSHSLGVAPQLVTFMGFTGNTGHSFGAFDGTDNRCSYIKSGAATQAQSTIYCLAFTESSGVDCFGAVTAVSSTDITITWTRTSPPAGIMLVTATLMATS